MPEANRAGDGYITLRHAPRGLDVAALRAYLAELVQSDPRNALPEGDNPPIFETPVVGVASAADPLFETLKREDVVGPIHVTPEHWLKGARSVVSFFAPFSREIKASYDRASAIPSLEWVSGRLNGEIFINVLRRALMRFVEAQGGRAVAPNLEPTYKAVAWRPMWSERHVAFIAGVGTFGLHAGLLTEKGAAGRIGSIVTDIEIAPTERPYAGTHDYCLWVSEGRCGACIKRCPVGAIAPEGKNHFTCILNGDRNIRPAFQEWGYHSCGHCQNNLPCSDKIPAKRGQTGPSRSGTA